MVPLGHLDQVASDSGVVFRGERGPRLEQIAAIRAKEIYEGALASSRAQAERERVGTPVPEVPEQEAAGPSGEGEAPSAIPPVGRKRGRPPKVPSRPSTSGRASSVPPKGTTPKNVSK